MTESKVLKKFFEEQHRKFKKRTYSIPRLTRVEHLIHSNHNEWLRHKVEAESAVSHTSGNPRSNGKIPPKTS